MGAAGSGAEDVPADPPCFHLPSGVQAPLSALLGKESFS